MKYPGTGIAASAIAEEVVFKKLLLETDFADVIFELAIFLINLSYLVQKPGILIIFCRSAIVW